MIKKMEHVALVVKNLDESIDYYSGMFGFKVRARTESSIKKLAFLYLDSQPGFEIELIQDLIDQDGYHKQGIVNHLAFTVEEMERTISFFREKGTLFHSDSPNIAADGTKTILFYGPNKELLQLIQPRKH